MANQIDIADAVVKVKLEKSSFGRDMKKMVREFDSMANKLSKTIIAPTIALGTLGVMKYLKTTDALARSMNASIIKLKFSFNQFLFRLGETIIKKYELVKVIDKLSAALNKIDSKKISAFLDVVKWTAITVLIMKSVAALVRLSGVITNIRNGMLELEGVKAVAGAKGGAVSTAVGTGAGFGITQAIVKGVVHFKADIISTFKKISISFSNAWVMAQAKSMSNETYKMGFIGKATDRITGIGRGGLGRSGYGSTSAMGKAGEFTASLVSFMGQIKAIGAILIRLAAPVLLVVSAFKAVFTTFQNVGVTFEWFTSSLSKVFTALEYLSNAIGSVVDVISIGIKTLGVAFALVAKTYTLGLVGNSYKDIISNYTDDVMITFQKRIDSWKAIGNKSNEASGDKSVYASSVSSGIGVTELNKAFQDYYSQTMMYDIGKQQVDLLKQIVKNTAFRGSKGDWVAPQVSADKTVSSFAVGGNTVKNIGTKKKGIDVFAPGENMVSYQGVTVF